MNRILIFVVLLVLGAGVYFFLDFIGGGEQDLGGPRDDEVVEDGDAREIGRARRASDRDRGDAATRRDDPDALAETKQAGPFGGLRGRLVRGEGGEPVADVEARFVDLTGEIVAGGKSDGEGRFEIAIRGVREAGLLLASGSGLVSKPLSLDPAAAGEWQDLGEIELKPAVVLEGRVVSKANRKPIAGATVGLYTHEPFDLTSFDFVGLFETVLDESPPLIETSTGEDGSFRFEQIPARHWVVLAKARGCDAVYSKPIEARAGVPNELEVTLATGMPISGRVVDHESRPVEGALVIAMNENMQFSGTFRSHKVRSGADGSFRFDGMDPETRMRVLCRADGHAAKTVDSVMGGAVDVEIVLRQAGRISGRVYDQATDAPIADAEVIAVDFGDSGTFEIAYSDAEGKYVIGNVPREGRGLMLICRRVGYSVVTERPAGREFGPEGVAVDGAELATGDVKKDIPMASGTGVAGRVYDADTGEPIAEAKVRLITSGSAFIGASDNKNLSAVTDAKGNYRMKGVPPGRFAVAATSPGYFNEVDDANGMFGLWGDENESSLRELVAGQQLEGVDVALRKGLVLAGRVVDPEGNPVTGATVFWLPSGEMGFVAFQVDPKSRRAISDAEGRFRFEGLRPEAEVTLEARHRLFPSSSKQSFQLGTTAREDLELVLREGGSLRGRLIMPDGSPATGQTLTLRSEDESGFFGMIMTGEREEPPSVVTDANGRFQFESLPAGKHRIEYRHAEGRFVLAPDSSSVEILPGRRLEKEFRLEMTRWISGRVIDSTGKSARGVSVSARPENGEPEPRGWGQSYGETDAEGRFHLSGLEGAETFTVEVMRWIEADDDPEAGVEVMSMKQETLAIVEGVASRTEGLVITLRIPLDD